MCAAIEKVRCCQGPRGSGHGVSREFAHTGRPPPRGVAAPCRPSSVAPPGDARVSPLSGFETRLLGHCDHCHRRSCGRGQILPTRRARSANILDLPAACRMASPVRLARRWFPIDGVSAADSLAGRTVPGRPRSLRDLPRPGRRSARRRRPAAVGGCRGDRPVAPTVVSRPASPGFGARPQSARAALVQGESVLRERWPCDPSRTSGSPWTWSNGDDGQGHPEQGRGAAPRSGAAPRPCSGRPERSRRAPLFEAGPFDEQTGAAAFDPCA